MSRHRSLWARLAAVAVLASVVLAGCGDDDGGGAAGGGGKVTLRLGYFPNVTHAPAILGVEDGYFARALGADVTLQTKTFNAGPEATESLFSEAVDATFIGPNPAINAFAKSDGEAIRIVAGTTSGGAALVVKPEINGPPDLKGATLATPQLGNTQDIALRAWLKQSGLAADTSGGGDVSIRPQANADTLTTFRDGHIDGGWVPEPWATRLVQEGGGKVLVDERELWPDGRFVTTHLVVRTEFLEDHPDVVERLLEGLVDAEAAANTSGDARTRVNDGIERVTTKRLPDATIDAAWSNLTFTTDPIASSLAKSKDDAVATGLLEPVDLDGIYDLSVLNRVLMRRGLPEVTDL